MIDALARNGEIHRAYHILTEYNEYNNGFANNENDIAMWLALLSGCRRCKMYELAQTIYNEFETKVQSKYCGKCGKGNEEFVRKCIGSASVLLADTF